MSRLKTILVTAAATAGIVLGGQKLDDFATGVKQQIDPSQWSNHQRTQALRLCHDRLEQVGLPLTSAQVSALQAVITKNDTQIAVGVVEAKRQQAANFLDNFFQQKDPGGFDPDSNGLRNLVTKVALASSPNEFVGRYTMFRATAEEAETLKATADNVAGVVIGCVEDCGTEALMGTFPVMRRGLDGGSDYQAEEDGGLVWETRPYKSASEFLGSQSPPLVEWKNPDGGPI